MHPTLALAVAALAACAPTPDNPVDRPPLIQLDLTAGRVTTTSDAPMQFAIEFAREGVRMPEGLFLDGMNRIANGSCPTESGVGIGVYPAINAVAPMYGGPTMPTAALDSEREGPVVVQLVVTWTVQYSCPGAQEASGTSTFTIFPNGRIVRHDIARPSTTTLPEASSCGCGGPDHYYFTSFWSFVDGAQHVNPDGTLAAQNGVQVGCAVYPNHTIGVAWPDTSTRVHVPGTGVTAWVHDWVADALTLPSTQQEVTGALMLSEETVPANCDDVIADLDDFPLLIGSEMVFTDNSGIYSDERRHTDPIVISPPRPLPRGFALSVDVGDRASLEREPPIDDDWYFIQDDGAQTLFWFPDGLAVGDTITIYPE